MRWAILYYDRSRRSAKVLGFTEAANQPAAMSKVFDRFRDSKIDSRYFVRIDSEGDPMDYRKLVHD